MKCIKKIRKKKNRFEKPEGCEHKKGRIMVLSKTVCDSKKSRFIKEQGPTRLLSSLSLKIPILGKLPIVGDILFNSRCIQV